jgi:hypothetical protein
MVSVDNFPILYRGLAGNTCMNGPFNNTLDPCSAGWELAILNPTPTAKIPPSPQQVATNYFLSLPPMKPHSSQDCIFSSASAPNSIQCTTHSTPYIRLQTQLPPHTVALSFDFAFSKATVIMSLSRWTATLYGRSLVMDSRTDRQSSQDRYR